MSAPISPTLLAPERALPLHGRAGPWVWKLWIVLPLLVLLAAVSSTVAAVYASQQAAMRQMASQQAGETALLASMVAGKLEQSQKALAALAETAAPWLLDARPIAPQWLGDEQQSSARYFDSLVLAHGSKVFRIDARDSAHDAGEIEPGERDLLRRVMVEGKPQVSDPVTSARHGPSMALGIPLRDRAGVVQGALAGVLRLRSQSLLPLLPQGQDQAELAVMTASGTIISHTDPAKILGVVADEPALLLAQQLWVAQGASATKGQGGEMVQWTPPYLISIAEIPSARWAMVRVSHHAWLPSFWREGLHGWWCLPAVAVVLAVTTWWWLWWHTRKLRALMAEGATPSVLPREGDELDQWAQRMHHLQQQQEHAVLQLAQQHRLTQVLMAHAPFPMLLLHDERIAEISQGLVHMLGYERQALLDRSVHVLAMQPGALHTVWEKLVPALLRHSVADTQVTLRHQSGAPVVLTIQLRYMQDTSSAWVWCFAQPSRGRLSAVASISGRLDGLTLLPNYDALLLYLTDMQQAAHAVDARHGSAVLLYANVDHMSAINALAGHAQGDMVLQHVARQIQQLQPFQGLAARVAGDTFALVLPQCSADKADALALQLCEALYYWQPELRGKQFVVTVSVGLLRIGAHLTGAQQIIRAADMACYEAKRLGGNRVCWSPESATEAVQ